MLYQESIRFFHQSGRFILKSEKNFQNLGNSHDRPVCNQKKCQTSSVCFSSSRPRSLGRGRSFSQLDRSNSVCISSSIDHVQGTRENHSEEMPGDPDCSSMADTTLVQSPAKPFNRSSSETFHHSNLLKQTDKPFFHSNPAHLKLHAWRLQGGISKTRDFQMKLLAESWVPKESQLDDYMAQDGRYFALGASQRRQILSRPLPL